MAIVIQMTLPVITQQLIFFSRAGEDLRSIILIAHKFVGPDGVCEKHLVKFTPIGPGIVSDRIRNILNFVHGRSAAMNLGKPEKDNF